MNREPCPQCGEYCQALREGSWVATCDATDSPTPIKTTVREPRDMPSMYTTAVAAVEAAAEDAQYRPTWGLGARGIFQALEEFSTVADTHGAGAVVTWMYELDSHFARAISAMAPRRELEGMLSPVLLPGDGLIDPDAAVQGNPGGQALLAAQRFLAAWARGDADMADALYRAYLPDAPGDRRAAHMSLLLADMYGLQRVERERREGTLLPQQRTALRIRRHNGVMGIVGINPGPAAATVDRLEPIGGAITVTGTYQAHPGARDQAVADMHDTIERIAYVNAVTLCPGRHDDDVALNALHPEARAAAMGEILRQEAPAGPQGAPTMCVRVWRHTRLSCGPHGPREGSPRQASRAPRPWLWGGMP